MPPSPAPDPDAPDQTGLFGDELPPATASSPRARAPKVEPRVTPAAVPPEQTALADALAPHVRLGTSSWHFPGWRGLLWADAPPAAVLSRQGLAAYAGHPLMRTVSLDRAFYRVPDAATYAALAAQVPPSFRFVVKAPASLTDAVRRDPGSGQPMEANPGFLDPQAAVDAALAPAAAGLGARLGVFVLQVSPLPPAWLDDPARLLDALVACLTALRDDPRRPAGSIVGVEVRDPSLLGPDLAAALRAAGAVYVLGLHDRMPPAEDQLPMLRAQWPAPFVCRWNLHRGIRYGEARARFEPFDRMVAPDEPTRAVVARVAAATAAAGQPVYVTINNKAEGSAPRSVVALAEAIAAMDRPGAPAR